MSLTPDPIPRNLLLFSFVCVFVWFKTVLGRPPTHYSVEKDFEQA